MALKLFWYHKGAELFFGGLKKLESSTHLGLAENSNINPFVLVPYLVVEIQ